MFSLSFVGGSKSAGTPGRRIELFEVLPAIQRNPRLPVNFVSFGHFDHNMEKNITVIGMF